MGRTLLLLQPSILALAFAAGLPAADPPPVARDASGIAWDLQVDEDGTRSLRVGCTPGRRYTVEQSADLVQWSPVRSWTGLAPGQVVAVDLFVGPPPVAGGGAPPPPASGAMPLTASLAVQPVDDGSTALCWWRGGSSSCVRILEPASGGSWGPPTLTTLHIMELDGWTVLLQSSDLLWRHSSLTLPPADPPLAPDDAAFHAVLLANRAVIAAAIQGIHDNQQAALEYARLHGAPPAPPTAGRFFRVREESGIDSDGDGLTDEQELALGLNIFFTDTDGDGMDDRFEVEHNLNARSDADAWLDPDGDGLANIEEASLGTDPRNDDTDGDGVKDDADAVPTVRAIDWTRTPESSYAWIPITGAPLHPGAVTMAEISNDPVVLFGPGSAVPLAWDSGCVKALLGGMPADLGEGGWILGINSDATGPPVVCWPPGAADALPVADDETYAENNQDIFCRALGLWGGGTQPGYAGPLGRLLLAAVREATETDPAWSHAAEWHPGIAAGGGWEWSFAESNPVGWARFAADGTVCETPLSGTGTDVLRRPGGLAEQSPVTGGTYWVTPPGRMVVLDGSATWRIGNGDGQWRIPVVEEGGPAVLQGGRKMNRRGEVLDTSVGRLWRNGKWTAMADLLPSDLKAAGWQVTAGDINDNGMMVVGLRASTTASGSDYDQVGFLAPIELDVNNDGLTADTVDGLGGYLPGYEGSAAKLHTGADFEHATYAGPQAMRLVLRGFGTGTVDAADFKIVGVTNHKGFCGNGDDATHFGTGKDEDFSFEAEGNLREIGGQVADGMVSAPLFCKDYGGWCEIEIVLKKGGQPATSQPVHLTVPLDGNGDQIADLWQDQQIDKWNDQFKPQPPHEKNLTTRNTMASGTDAEEADSDGPGPSPGMAAPGDGLTVLDEYRGYILDGGPGLDAPGHRRLSAARKELLVECSVESDLTSEAKNGPETNRAGFKDFNLDDAMATVSQHYRDPTKGGVIDLYWTNDVLLPGEDVHYGDDLFPQRKAYEWSEDFEHRIRAGGGTIPWRLQASGVPLRDEVLKKQKPLKHLELYGQGSPLEHVVDLNRNAKQKSFAQLLLPTRLGELEGGIDKDGGVDPSVPRYLDDSIQHGHSEGYWSHSFVCVAAVADEGLTYYKQGFQRHLTKEEFSRLGPVTIAHEIGHQTIGGVHIDTTDTKYLMGNGGFVNDSVVRGLDAYQWQPEEISRMNLSFRFTQLPSP